MPGRVLGLRLCTFAASAGSPRMLERVTVTVAAVQPGVSDSSRPHDLQLARPPCPSPPPGVVHCIGQMLGKQARALSQLWGPESASRVSAGLRSPPALGELPRPRPASRGPLSSHTASLPRVCTSSLHFCPENTRPLTGDHPYLVQPHHKLIIFTSHHPLPREGACKLCPHRQP